MSNSGNYQISARLTDPKKVCKDAGTLRLLEEKINSVMTSMFQKPENGGNPFLYSIAMSKPHELLDQINGMDFKTAATDGKKFYWHPSFLLKLDSWETGVVMNHEVLHDLFFHPMRGMNRQYPRIWNVAIDYVVNSMIWDDHDKTNRGSKNNRKPFEGNLGNPWSLQDLLNYIDGAQDAPKGVNIFADKSLYGRSPDSIYDEIVRHIQNSPRKCPSCGKLSMDSKGNSKKDQKKDQKKSDSKDQKGSSESNEEKKGQGQGQGGDEEGQGQGQGQGCGGQEDGQGCGGPGGQCPCCGEESDVFEGLDTHLPSKSTKEEIQTDMMRAAMRCKSMGIGSVPGAVEDALAELMKPQLKFRDIVRNCMIRKSQDAGLKNDWSRCRKRYFAAKPSQYLPKRYNHKPRWIAMIDTSGSMSDDDIAYGISQLQVLGPNTDGYLIPCDASPKWDAIKKIDGKSDLKKTKIVGRGGTAFDEFFRDFPKHLGSDFDVVVVITDADCPIPPKNLAPKTDVVWVITNNRHQDFKPLFGRVAPLRDERV